MKKTHARLTVLLDPDKKSSFDALCAALGRTSSEVVRQLIQDYIRAGGDASQPGLLPPPVQRRERSD